MPTTQTKTEEQFSGGFDASLADVRLNKAVRESVAQLCANIYVSNLDRGPAKLAIASADAREGRTSLALALGIQVTGTLGAKALVVEANLRSPGFSRLIDLPDEAPGFTDLLAGESTPLDSIHKMGVGLPDVLPAGTLAPDEITKWITRERLERLLRRLNTVYPYLLIEVPPVNHYPEAQVLIALSDAVILTVRSGVTSRETVSLAAKRIESLNGKFLGVVLNQKQFPLPGWLYRRL